MDDTLLTFKENNIGMYKVAKLYIHYKELAKEQIKKEDSLTDDDLDIVVIGLMATKILVLEGKLDEKYFESAIS